MAFTEFYARSGGSNLNAGSTDADAAAFTYAAGTFVRSTGVFTVAAGNPLTDGVAVGSFASVYTTAGATVATFVARVTARDATTITVSLTVIAGATSTVSEAAEAATLKVAGAWSGPDDAIAFPFAFAGGTLKNTDGDQPRVNFKGTFTVSTGITHAVAGPITFQGYTTTAGDGGRATLTGGATTAMTVLYLNAADVTLGDFIVTNPKTDAGSPVGMLRIAGARGFLFRVTAHTCRQIGIWISAQSSTLLECEAYGCNVANTAGYGGFFGTAQNYIRCHSHDNLGSNGLGFGNSGNLLTGCVAERNGQHGIQTTASLTYILNCDFYRNGANGIGITQATNSSVYVENCNFAKNGGWGIGRTSTGTIIGAINSCRFGAGSQANASGTIETTLNDLMQDDNSAYADDQSPWTVPGEVATKTSGTEATVTLEANHGFTNGNFDVYWAGGSRLNVPGTVATNTLSLNGGSGTDFPVATTDVYVFQYGDFNLRLAASRGTGRGDFTQTAGSVTGYVAATTSKPDIGAASRGGTFPLAEDVETGVTYGAAGTEFTGTLAAGGGGGGFIQGSSGRFGVQES